MWKLISKLLNSGTKNGKKKPSPITPEIPVGEGDPDARRSISIVSDCSGSMEGKKMDQAKKAMVASLDNCPEDLEVGLVCFGGEVSVSAGLTYNHYELQETVRSLIAGGRTPLLKALEAAREKHIIKSHTETGLVIYTDGKPTEAGPKEILRYGKKLKSNGTTIVTVGIGEDVNESFLKSLASSRDDFYYAEAPEEVFSGITEAIGSLVTVK